MAYGCGAKCAKIILIIYNILFLLTGLALIALGIWLLVAGDVKNLVALTTDAGNDSKLFRNSAILLIAMGALVVVVSALGFAGAITENVIVLGIYIALLIVIFCGEIAGGVIAIVFKDKIILELKDILHETLEKELDPDKGDSYYMDYNITDTEIGCKASGIGYLWDFVQIKFSCCGVETGNQGYEKLNTTNNFQTMCVNNLKQRWVPLSCCKLINSTDFSSFHMKPDNQYKSQNLVTCEGDGGSIYSEGCYEKIAYWLERYAPVLIGIGIGFAMLQMFGIIFAVCLCVNAEDDD